MAAATSVVSPARRVTVLTVDMCTPPLASQDDGARRWAEEGLGVAVNARVHGVDRVLTGGKLHG
jgi:hypothetical protein